MLGTYKGQIVAVKEVYLDKVPEAYCLWEGIFHVAELLTNLI